MAYPGEPQEMVLDAFVRALAFYGGVPRRVIIDNPKTMVTYVSRSKDRVYHPRFLALMNHYVMEPVACTPASGWEKGQIENQVQHIRQWLFTPKLDFSDLDALNAWLSLRCNELGIRAHPDQKDQTIDARAFPASLESNSGLRIELLLIQGIRRCYHGFISGFTTSYC